MYLLITAELLLSTTVDKQKCLDQILSKGTNQRWRYWYQRWTYTPHMHMHTHALNPVTVAWHRVRFLLAHSWCLPWFWFNTVLFTEIAAPFYCKSGTLMIIYCDFVIFFFLFHVLIVLLYEKVTWVTGSNSTVWRPVFLPNHENISAIRE